MTEPPEFEADYEPFTGKFGIPGKSDLEPKTSSFFPMLMRDSRVLELIGEAYEESGCHPYGFWSVPVTNSLIGEPMTIEGSAENHLITTAYPLTGVAND